MSITAPLEEPAAPLPASARTAAGITLEDSIRLLLDRAGQLVQAGDFMGAFRLLGAPLSALWTEARGSGRAADMQRWCSDHALHALLQQDPYTHRARTKPRGYAGDAVMMDFIYTGSPPEGTTELGRGVFSATTRVSMGLSVLYRRQLLKSLIDDTVVNHEAGRILSVASGHARELQGSLVAAADAAAGLGSGAAAGHVVSGGWGGCVGGLAPALFAPVLRDSTRVACRAGGAGQHGRTRTGGVLGQPAPHAPRRQRPARRPAFAARIGLARPQALASLLARPHRVGAEPRRAAAHALCARADRRPLAAAPEQRLPGLRGRGRAVARRRGLGPAGWLAWPGLRCLLGRAGTHRAGPPRHLGHQLVLPRLGPPAARHGRWQRQCSLAVAAVLGRELAQQPPCAAGAGSLRPRLEGARPGLVGGAGLCGAGLGARALRLALSRSVRMRARPRPARSHRSDFSCSGFP